MAIVSSDQHEITNEVDFLSWHNSALETPADGRGRSFLLHDVTLRDGEQQAGISFTRAEKIEIAKALDAFGVDRIEAGRVDISDEELDVLSELASLDLRAQLWAVGRSRGSDAEKAVGAGVAGMGIVMAANRQHLRHSKRSLDETIDSALSCAEVARKGGLKTTLLLADSSRMSLASLERVTRRISSSWLYDGIALMDSHGVLNPEGTSHLVGCVKQMTDLKIELHSHNDFGLGVANAIAGLKAGADVVHASALGLGERVGNTPLEELALAAELLYGMKHSLVLPKLTELTDLVQRISGIKVAANKPVIGESYSQIESSFVAAEMARIIKEGDDIRWLFPFSPELIGGKDIELVIGKFSGSMNIDHALSRLGIRLDEKGKAELLLSAQEAAGRAHRLISDDELLMLIGKISAKRLGWLTS